MRASDEDTEHTIGRKVTRRPTVNHNMVYVECENLKLRPFYRHETGVSGLEQSQTNPSRFDTGA
jgi:hypothetical protein